MAKTKYLDSNGVSILWGQIKAKLSENAYDDTEVKNLIKTNTDAIGVLNGTGEGSVSKTVADEVAKIVAGADTDFDTLKEIADWIANDETGAAALGNRVTALEGLVDADKAAAWSAAESNAKAYTDEQIAEIEALTEAEILTAINNAG